MLKSYLKIGWRNLLKDKTFTALNIIGLSMAFGAAILLSMAAFFDLSFDNFHENGGHLFQVYTEQQYVEGPEAGTSQPTPFAHALKDEVPGVERISRVLEDGVLALHGENEIGIDALWVDSDFFEMFTFPVEKGSTDSFSQDLGTVVITPQAASKLFGTEDAVGETFRLLIGGEEKPFTVSAVTETQPQNTSLGFEMAIRFENNPEYLSTKEQWNAQYHEVYVQLQKAVSVAQFERNTQAFITQHYQEVIDRAKRDGAQADADGYFRSIKLLPISDIHFTNFKRGFANVVRTYPYFILGIAFLIIFIASVNFINMNMAKSASRLKEIGMRKALGARTQQLFYQFWSESFLIFTGALVIGIALSVSLLGSFKSIYRTGATLEVLLTPMTLVGGIFLVLVITVLVGGYPAILLSRFGTVQSLQGKLLTNGKNHVRNILMILQFSMAILLISGTLVFIGQIDYMRNKDLGYDKEQVISFPMNGKKDSYAALGLLRQELKGQPTIINVSAADSNLGTGRDGSQSSSAIGFDYKGRIVGTNFLVVDHQYIQTLGIQMVQGRSFESWADSTGVLINETMVKALQEKDPLSAQLDITGEFPSPVLGVVKDYHFQDLDRTIQPLTFFMSHDLALTYAYVKVAPGDMAKSFDLVAEAWSKIEPNAEFLGSYLDENMDRTFRREKETASLIASGSVIAIVLSCIGLFAMSMLVVTQRTKEIGIRKVVGAKVGTIALMLTKDFLKLVLYGFLIATPIAWWFLKQWLDNYANRISIHPGFFMAAGALVLLIAILTVGYKTIKAATQNPVKSLRTE